MNFIWSVLYVFCYILEKRITPQGQVYYLHTQTGVSTWHDPRVPRAVPAAAIDRGTLPPGENHRDNL